MLQYEQKRLLKPLVPSIEIQTRADTSASRSKKRSYRCYYCRRISHIRSHCKLYISDRQDHMTQVQPTIKQVWLIKKKGKILAALTSFKAEVTKTGTLKWQFTSHDLRIFVLRIVIWSHLEMGLKEELSDLGLSKLQDYLD